jgi:hypothetical protein
MSKNTEISKMLQGVTLTGNLTLPVTNTSTPALTFAGDTNTGIASAAADTLNIIVAGSSVRTIDGSTELFTKVQRAPDGTAALPAYSFSNDGNTGIYSDAADTLGITAGGSQRATFNATNFYSVGAIHAPNGTAALPALSFNGDSNTGLYWVGADSLGASIGGTLRVTFNTTDVTSTVPLYVPVGSAAAPTYTFTADTNTGFFQAGADQVAVTCGGSEKVRFTSGGQILVGITATPSASVHGVQIGEPGNNLWQSSVSVTTSFAHMIFYNTNGAVGSITTSGTSTAYNTTSDYRLKTGARPVLNAVDRINSVPVREYKWLNDPSGPYSVGFFAHEMQVVLPDVVTGVKDQLDDKGQLYPQMIDYSKAVPLLWAAVQELSAKVAALEARP